MKGSAKRFRVTTEMEAGSWRRFQTAVCGGCGREGKVSDATANGAPPEMVKRKFTQMGWAMGQKPTDDECPKCVKGKRELTPQQKRNAYLAIKRREEEQKMTAAAQPPRQATQADKAKIREALLDRYDEAFQRYLDDDSDRKLGDELKVPWAWVSSMREAMGLGPDRNEASLAFNGELKTMKADMAALLESAAALEERIAKLERGGWRSAA